MLHRHETLHVAHPEPFTLQAVNLDTGTMTINLSNVGDSQLSLHGSPDEILTYLRNLRLFVLDAAAGNVQSEMDRMAEMLETIQGLRAALNGATDA